MISRRLIPVFLICAAWGALAQGRPAAGPGAAKGARSDVEVEEAIRDRFARSKSAADHFTVRVHGGVAIIEGRTDVVQRKGSATRMAKSAGARKVINKIQVSEAAREKASSGLSKGRRRVQVKRSEARP